MHDGCWGAWKQHGEVGERVLGQFWAPKWAESMGGFEDLGDQNTARLVTIYVALETVALRSQFWALFGLPNGRNIGRFGGFLRSESGWT